MSSSEVEVRILDKFVKSGDVFLGSVLMEDFTVENPLKIVVTLHEVYPVERHRLVRGQDLSLIGTIEAKGKGFLISCPFWHQYHFSGSAFYMNVLSWSDVSFAGFDDDDDSVDDDGEKPLNVGPSRSADYTSSNGKEWAASSARTLVKSSNISYGAAGGRLSDSSSLLASTTSHREAKANRYSFFQRYPRLLCVYFRRDVVGDFLPRNEHKLKTRFPVKEEEVSSGPYEHHYGATSSDLGPTRRGGVPAYSDSKLETKAVRLSLQGRDSVHSPSIHQDRRSSLPSEKERKVKPSRLSLTKLADDPTTKVCPVLHKYTTVADLEAADLLVDPWHSTFC